LLGQTHTRVDDARRGYPSDEPWERGACAGILPLWNIEQIAMPWPTPLALRFRAGTKVALLPGLPLLPKARGAPAGHACLSQDGDYRGMGARYMERVLSRLFAQPTVPCQIRVLQDDARALPGMHAADRPPPKGSSIRNILGPRSGEVLFSGAQSPAITSRNRPPVTSTGCG
jgi:hypothetical protein